MEQNGVGARQRLTPTVNRYVISPAEQWWRSRHAGAVLEPGTVSERRTSEVAVDEPLDPLFEPSLQLGRLLLGDPTGPLSLVDPLRRSRDERLHEAALGLALLFGDLRQSLVGERLAKLRLRQAEICGRVAQEVELPYAAEAAIEVRPAVAEEKRDVGRPQSLLHHLGLLFGKPAGVDGLVEPVLQRLVQCVGERVGLDSELCRRVVDDRLALLGGRERGRRRERSDRAEADRHERLPWQPRQRSSSSSWFSCLDRTSGD